MQSLHMLLTFWKLLVGDEAWTTLAAKKEIPSARTRHDFSFWFPPNMCFQSDKITSISTRYSYFYSIYYPLHLIYPYFYSIWNYMIQQTARKQSAGRRQRKTTKPRQNPAIKKPKTLITNWAVLAEERRLKSRPESDHPEQPVDRRDGLAV